MCSVREQHERLQHEADTCCLLLSFLLAVVTAQEIENYTVVVVEIERLVELDRLSKPENFQDSVRKGCCRFFYLAC